MNRCVERKSYQFLYWIFPLFLLTMCNPDKSVPTADGQQVTYMYTETTVNTERVTQAATITPATPVAIKTNTPTILPTSAPTSSSVSLFERCNDSEKPTDFETNTIIFVANWDGDEEIYSIHADGTRLSQLTTNQVSDDEPVISPIGDKIGYESIDTVNGDTQIFAMNLDGSEKVLLSSNLHVARNAGIAWSPDGNWIVFSVIDDATGLSDLYSVENDGASLHNFTQRGFPGLVGEPVWSPDGQTIAFTAYDPRFQYADVHVVSAETGDQLFAVKHPESPIVTTSRWNPLDPNQLLYLTRNPGKHISQIGIAKLVPLSQFILTEKQSEKDSVIWSIDGKIIAYVEPTYEYSTTLQSETLIHSVLHLIDLDGNEKSILDSQTEIKYPSWSFDGNYLIILIENAADSVFDLYSLNICDETIKLVISGISGKSWPRLVP